MIHVVEDNRTGKIRVRCVSAEGVAKTAEDRARETGKPAFRVAHGGSVPNSYGYSAETEGVLAVAIPMHGDIHVAVYACQLPANKVSLGGVAATCLPASRPIFDSRYGAKSTETAKAAVIAEATTDLEQMIAGLAYDRAKEIVGKASDSFAALVEADRLEDECGNNEIMVMVAKKIREMNGAK